MKEKMFRLINSLLWKMGYTISNIKAKPWDKGMLEYYKYEKSVRAGNPIEYHGTYPPKNFEPTVSEWEEFSCFFKPGMTVCELGPGTGRYTELYAHTCKQVYLVDFSERICSDILSDKFRDYGNVEAVHSPDCRIPRVSSSSLDLFIGFSVFAHLDMEQIVVYMSEGMRMLKPGGKMIIEYLSLTGDVGWKRFLSRIPADCSRSTFRYQSQPEMERIAERIGFKILKSILDKNDLNASYLVLEKPADSSVPENFSILNEAPDLLDNEQTQQRYAATGIAKPLNFESEEKQED